MKKSFFSQLTLAVFVAGSMLVVHAKAADPSNELRKSGGSKLLTEWMGLHLKAIPVSKIPSHHTRQLAYMGVAVYESIVAGDPGYRSLAGLLNGYNYVPPVPTEKDFCWQASANAAMAETFRYFYADNPHTLLQVDSMEQACRQWLMNYGFSEGSMNAGSAYGKRIAQAVIEWSKTDGDDKANGPYVLPKGSGLYEPTPPAFIKPIIPYLGKERTFVRGSIDNTVLPPPVAFSTDPQTPFYKMAEEVYTLSQQKDAEKVSMALYWDDFPDGKTRTGGGHWESILKTIAEQLNLSLIDGSRAFAVLFITMQDASIGCFRDKYAYNLLRPVTYVHKYLGHPEWSPLIITPPHPEYPAAHAVVSMSAATILTQLLGDKVSFTDNTYAYRNYPARHFNNFNEAGHEAGMSRLYGGIHYRPSIEAGFKQGTMIANNIAGKLDLKKGEMMGQR